MIRRLIFAHELPKPTTLHGQEALAEVRLEVELPERGMLAHQAWPRIRTLGDIAGDFSRVELPRFLEELTADESQRGLDTQLPAQVEAWLAHRAPKSHALLFERTRCTTRSSVYVIERRPAGAPTRLALSWRPAGEHSLRQLACPLLSTAEALARGELPAFGASLPSGTQTEVARLLRAVLEARWISRRLPPGLAWDAATSTYSLRAGQSGARMAEHLIEPRAAQDPLAIPPEHQLLAPDVPASAPKRGDTAPKNSPNNPPGLLIGLSLHFPGHVQPFELDVDPHDDLPLPVVQVALAWLFGAAPESGSLYLDSLGRPPKE